MNTHWILHKILVFFPALRKDTVNHFFLNSYIQEPANNDIFRAMTLYMINFTLLLDILTCFYMFDFIAIRFFPSVSDSYFIKFLKLSYLKKKKKFKREELCNESIK